MTSDPPMTSAESGHDGRARVVEIHTTCGDRAGAEAMARSLVESRLAACGQVSGPITSAYRWKGEVETATEHRLTLKTVRPRIDACVEELLRLHPYDLPEIVIVEVAASAAFAQWVEEGTRP